jgi:hypothetical protein
MRTRSELNPVVVTGREISARRVGDFGFGLEVHLGGIDYLYSLDILLYYTKAAGLRSSDIPHMLRKISFRGGASL